MHPYSIDSKERITIVSVLGIISEVLTSILQHQLSWLELKYNWVLWFHAPSALVIFGALFFAFDNFIWKWNFLFLLKVVKVPNLNGLWSGTLTTSFDNHKSTFPVELKITQTWSKVFIKLSTSSSHSSSQTASLLVENSAEISLSYEYQNTPLNNSVLSMNTHQGYASLKLRGNGVLEGGYYTDRGRVTFGTIIFTRK